MKKYKQNGGATKRQNGPQQAVRFERTEESKFKTVAIVVPSRGRYENSIEDSGFFFYSKSFSNACQKGLFTVIYPRKIYCHKKFIGNGN